MDIRIPKVLTDASFKFALESLKKCIMMESETSTFFSPHLLYQNLLVAYFGAMKDFEDTLKKTLYIPDDISKENLEYYYQEGGANQFSYIENGLENSYTCRIYSRFLISDSKELYKGTANIFSSAHRVKEFNFEFRPDHVRNFINNAITCVSQRCIQNLLPPDSIDIDTEIVLFNTIYCKGELNDSFDFDTTDYKSTKKSILKQASNYKFNSLDTYVIEVPWKEKEVSTFFFFPPHYSNSNKNKFTENDRMLNLIEQLTTEKGSRELHKLLDNGIPQQMDNIVFPTFKIEHDLQIYKLLNMLGIPDFTPSVCIAHLYDFSTYSLALGDVIHRVSIDVTKTDITATASSVFFTYNGYKHVLKVPNTVDVPFPCICLIYNRSHHSILFCGVLKN